MLLHILQRDLKRKKTMNIILLLFVIMATMFLSGSVNNLLTVSGVLDSFMELSRVPDFLAISVGASTEDEMDAYLEESPEVRESEKSLMLNLVNEDISILQCVEDPGNTKYERTNTLAVCALPDQFSKVFMLDGEEVVLERGEAAIPKIEADKNSLAVGDKIQIRVKNVTQTFTIAAVVKDAVFGSSMIGFKRLYVGEEDFQEFLDQDSLAYTKLYQVMTDSLDTFQEEWKKQKFQVIAELNIDLVKMCYVFDMVMAGVLIIVSICLILIAFLILRFTILFTLQEDYKEIGIMKAIGIRDRGIKFLYLVKYFAISVTGAIIGMLISFPFERFLLKQVMVNLVIGETTMNVGVNVGCTVLIVVVVLAFCYSCTNKLKKFTAMEAIRNGSSGERFADKTFYKLSRRKKLSPACYMAVNDILSNFRRFAVLCIIFCLGTLLILLPLVAINTLKSDTLLYSFGMVPSAVYIDTGKMENFIVEEDVSPILNDLIRIEDTLRKEEIESRVRAEIGYIVACYSDNPEETYNYFTFQSLHYGGTEYQILEGRFPELANEVMLTDMTAREMGVEIGDSIYFTMAEGSEEFVVCGINQSMMNMGKGFRVSENALIDFRYISGVTSVQIDLLTDMDETEALTRIAEIFPDYKVSDGTAFADKMIGGILPQLDSMKVLIVGIILLINALITILIMKTLISREHGEIAMLKSIGFSDHSVRKWQTVRILLVLLIAIGIGVILSKLLTPFVIGPLFAMMGGTNMRFFVNPWESYLLYPLLLLVMTGAVAYLCSAETGKVELKEVNNLE